MSGFSLDWLDLREPADRAARDPALLQRAAAWLERSAEAVVVDLGCGSGSTFRALDPLLRRKPVWRLVDNDEALLAEAGRRAGPGGNVEPVPADLSDLGRLSFHGASLVTASALLDLVSETWVATLAGKLASSGAGLYAALSYDGQMHWAEPHPLDEAVTAAFNAHQQTDKGFGQALGPAAAELAAEQLKASGFVVLTAASPWRMASGEADLERALIEGVAAAAAETGRVGKSEVEAWKSRRFSLAGSGCEIGHQDLLALPDF